MKTKKTGFFKLTKWNHCSKIRKEREQIYGNLLVIYSVMIWRQIYCEREEKITFITSRFHEDLFIFFIARIVSIHIVVERT